jgi:hypothetical protein
MKKLLIIFVIIFLFATISVDATNTSFDRSIKPYSPIIKGAFEGEISAESEMIGVISGNYTFFPIIRDGLALNIIRGQWEIFDGVYAGKTGKVFCIGGRNFQIGRINVDETEKKIPIVCQISLNYKIHRFSGDIKLIFGPVFYSSGNFE